MNEIEENDNVCGLQLKIISFKTGLNTKPHLVKFCPKLLNFYKGAWSLTLLHSYTFFTLFYQTLILGPTLTASIWAYIEGVKSKQPGSCWEVGQTNVMFLPGKLVVAATLIILARIEMFTESQFCKDSYWKHCKNRECCPVSLFIVR